jgi:hypothetical protein
MRLAVSVRSFVAPAPTGSRMIGTPSAVAFLPALSIDAIHASSSVPMFSTSALAKATISSTSFSACAITGDAPAASRRFAVKFITT